MRMIEDITNFIFLEDKLERADIIFIPGGSHPELGEYAAELWKQNLAPIVLPSGNVSIKTGKFAGVRSKRDLYSKDYVTEWEFLTDVLKISGVSADSILKEDKSTFTKENAIFSRRVIDESGLNIKRAILCCKSFHARRAFMYYQFAFPDTKIYVHPVPYYEKNMLISRENWYKTEVGIKRVLGELRRCGEQFEEEFIRLLDNKES